MTIRNVYTNEYNDVMVAIERDYENDTVIINTMTDDRDIDVSVVLPIKEWRLLIAPIS